MDAAKFLNALFGDPAGPDALVSVWTLPDKAARFFADCDVAAACVNGLQQAAPLACRTPLSPPLPDVYFGCGLYRPGITGGRGKAEDVVGIVGLWADVDFGPCPVTGKKRLKDKDFPADLEDASALIARLGVQPSIVVHSGHGLQPWWLFKEFLPVGDGAAQLSERWGATIKAVAQAAGYGVDSVWDLARVLRPPGTMNRKAEPVRVTAVATEPLLRYEPSDLEAMCSVPSKTLYYGPTEPSLKLPSAYKTEDEYRKARDAYHKAHDTAGSLDLRPGRQLTVNLQQIEQRTAIDKRFEATWTGKRKDLPDGSPSSFDMALAHIGVLLEWSDQQIADMIFLWRTVRGLDPQKACRPDYIRETIRKARERQEEEQAAEKIAVPAKADEVPAADNPADPRRKPILDELENLLGIPIARWTQFGTLPADYVLHLKDGRKIVIGGPQNLRRQDEFGDRVYEVLKKRPPKLKGPLWVAVQNKLGLIVEDTRHTEGDREHEVCGWIQAMMEAGAGKHVQTDVNEALAQQTLLRRDGRLHVIRDKLHQYVTRSMGQKTVTIRQVEQALAAAGFKSTSVNPIAGARRTMKPRRFWRDDAGHFRVANSGEATDES